LLLIAASVAAAAEGGAGIRWSSDVTATLKESASSGKPLMVDVWAVWCKPCKLMDETTYRDPSVIREAGSTVPLKIDADVQTAFVDRYQVEVFPTILFLDGVGREVSRIEGLADASRLREAIAAVRGGYEDYFKAMAAKDDPAAMETAAGYLAKVGSPALAVDLLEKALKASKGEPAARLEALELRIAQARLQSGEYRQAAAVFDRLSGDATGPEIKGPALKGLVLAEKARGHKREAASALERLRSDYPDLAVGLE
jgi:thioredoxin-like negative regulator of GroEL